MNLAHVFDRTIAFHPEFAKLTGSINAALFLSQLSYWTHPDRKSTSEWIYKTAKEWEDETCLSRREQDGARKILRDLNIIEEKKEGIPCRLFYKINHQILNELLINLQFGGNSQTRRLFGASQFGGNSQTDNSKTTTETTTETTEEKHTKEKKEEEFILESNLPVPKDKAEEKVIETIWSAYPKERRVNKPKTFEAIRKSFKKIIPKSLLEKTEAYAKTVAGAEKRFIPHSTTWFNQERFNDDPETWKIFGNTKPGLVIDDGRPRKKIEFVPIQKI